MSNTIVAESNANPDAGVGEKHHKKYHKERIHLSKTIKNNSCITRANTETNYTPSSAMTLQILIEILID